MIYEHQNIRIVKIAKLLTFSLLFIFFLILERQNVFAETLKSWPSGVTSSASVEDTFTRWFNVDEFSKITVTLTDYSGSGTNYVDCYLQDGSGDNIYQFASHHWKDSASVIPGNYSSYGATFRVYIHAVSGSRFTLSCVGTEKSGSHPSPSTPETLIEWHDETSHYSVEEKYSRWFTADEFDKISVGVTRYTSSGTNYVDCYLQNQNGTNVKQFANRLAKNTASIIPKDYSSQGTKFRIYTHATSGDRFNFYCMSSKHIHNYN